MKRTPATLKSVNGTVESGEPVFRLPPYKVEKVFLTAAETVDWGLEMLGVPEAWRQTTGAGIKVAVLDTGIALRHPDLKDAIWEAQDFTDSMSGPADIDGHGTHVAGIIAARRDNNGVVGVAPKAKLLVGKVLGDDGSGSRESVISGIEWAVEAGADIISMSLGSPYPDESIHQAIIEANKAGVFVVSAAGNSGPSLNSVEYPGAFPEVVTVGAIDRRKIVAEYSSRGKEVDIVAPGDRILSTFPPRGYATLSGTSMATPFVSGVVALILAKHRKHGGATPIRGLKDLLEHLVKSAIDAGRPGFDPSYGFGIINPATLVSEKMTRLRALASQEV